MTDQDKAMAIGAYIAVWRDPSVEQIAEVIAGVIREEREACAKLADAEREHCHKGESHGGVGSELYVYSRAGGKAAKRIAKEIRARGGKP